MNEIRVLSTNEVAEVNGGVLPLIALLPVVTADAYLIGFTAGVITGHATLRGLGF